MGALFEKCNFKLIEIPRIRQDFKCMVNNERSLALNVGGFKIDV